MMSIFLRNFALVFHLEIDCKGTDNYLNGKIFFRILSIFNKY